MKCQDNRCTASGAIRCSKCQRFVCNTCIDRHLDKSCNAVDPRTGIGKADPAGLPRGRKRRGTSRTTGSRIRNPMGLTDPVMAARLGDTGMFGRDDDFDPRDMESYMDDEGTKTAEEEVRELKQIIEALKILPNYIGVVLRRDPQNRQMYFVNGPRGHVRCKWEGKRLKGGQALVLNDKMQIMEATDHYMVGPIGSVDGLLGDGMAEVGVKQEKRLVYFEDDMPIEVGDRVALDRNISVIIRNMGKEQPSYTSTYEPLAWNDIGGHTLAKEELISAIELPAKHPELFKMYGDVVPKGILLYGPPGCGKTLLGRGAATSLGKTHGASDNKGFFYLKGPELLDKYIGNSEASIRQIFTYARDHRKREGYPAIIFIDEAEALLATRGSRKSSDIDSTIIPTFLSEMDGFDPSSALIILATNLPDSLDPAVTREGRVDRKILVGPPDKDTAELIGNIHLKSMPVAGRRPAMMTALIKQLYNPERVLYEAALGVNPSDTEPSDGETQGAETKRIPIPLSYFVNGSLVAGVVKRSAMLAIRREVAGDKTSGICSKDMEAALDSVYEENRRTAHREFLSQFARDHNAVSITRLYDKKLVWSRRMAA